MAPPETRRPRQSSRNKPCYCYSYLLMGIMVAVLALIWLSSLGGGSPTSAPSTLLFASIVFRHGDRTPTDSFPTDPYRNESFWPEGLGQLTRVGKRGSFELGKWLRRRYSSFLPQFYSPNDVYTVSSDYDRCIMTALSLLAGLYPPVDDQVWMDDLEWQPIPVHTIPLPLDQLIVMKVPCPVYNYELEKQRKMSVPTPADLELFRYLTKHTEKNITDILGVEFLYNTLEIEEKRGLQLPEWAKTVYPEPCKTIAAKSLALFTGNTLMQRLRAGPLLKDILTHMSKKATSTLNPDRKLFLYSAHDITLVSLLRALQVPGTFKPDYNAAVIVELHQSTEGELFVRTMYLKNSTVDEADVILTACAQPCSLADFSTAMKAVVPKDWAEECSS